MPIAFHSGMKLITKLCVATGLVGAGILWERRRQQGLAPEDDRTDGAMGAADQGMAVQVAGIAEVDPEPMTQIAGEGIDPEVPVPPRVR
jgi:hypothetical protein